MKYQPRPIIFESYFNLFQTTGSRQQRDLLSDASIPPTLAAWACQTFKTTPQSACLLEFQRKRNDSNDPCKQACAVENSFSWNMSIENRSCFTIHLEVTCYKWPRRSEIRWECLALNFLHAQVLSDPEDHPLQRVCVDVPVHVGNIQQVCGVLVDDFSHFVYFGQVHVFSTCSFRFLLVAMPPKPISQLPCVSAPQQQKHGDKD